MTCAFCYTTCIIIEPTNAAQSVFRVFGRHYNARYRRERRMTHRCQSASVFGVLFSEEHQQTEADWQRAAVRDFFSAHRALPIFIRTKSVLGTVPFSPTHTDHASASTIKDPDVRHFCRILFIRHFGCQNRLPNMR